jgi:cytochrome c5
VAEAPQPAAEMAEPVAEAAAPVEAAAEAAADATAAAAAVVDGEVIYKQSCMACHAAGVAGAPKLGDSEAWSSRLAKGTDALVQSVTNGLNAMPPKGGCMTCSDDELRGAVEYMVSQGS